MLLTLLSASFSAFAQSADSELIKDWERAKAYTLEYLEAMPASSYNLKPTPEMRSFAEQMLHINDANYGFIATATGAAVPEGKGKSENTSNKTKDEVVQLVTEGYDFAIAQLKNISPDQLDKQITLFGRFELTGKEAINKAFEHQTHHRGQTTVYLRLAGVKPPAEKLF